MQYHHARDIEIAGRGLIDIGHFASEHPVVDVLARKLESIMGERSWKVKVSTDQTEKEPFQTI
jgi:putative NIF3 family GTP cyclohydrolase 1 type 2